MRTKSLEYEIRQQIIVAENQLNFITGSFPVTIARSNFSEQLKLPAVLTAGLPSSLLNRRPDILFAEWQLQATGADVNAATTDTLTTILLAAVSQGSPLEICELLIRNGADTSVTSAGYTLLELAEKDKREDIAAMLRNYKGGPYIEEFDRKSGWAEFQYPDSSAAVANGKYTFENKKVGHNWNVDKNILIDSTRDLTIETEMKFISGDDANFYGLLWGRKDRDNFHFFGVIPNGNYAYRKLVNGSWVEVIPAKISPAVQRGAVSNRLTIKKRGNKTEFYINDKLLDTAPFEVFNGNIGFHLNHTMKVEIEYLRVTYP
jgi:hypothetical protein